ncbi:hypothetical protein [Flaviflagellibacter deserti]|uniref:Pyrrolidone-carboxylate peptidase n=1 Tax=Flaviflagellibacter deserti TaxID=2267266 RepID=A0ABV9YYG5_9HYPH
MKVLITGFGPFDGGSNASEALVRAFEKRGATASGLDAETLILPVDTERADSLLDEAVRRFDPDRLLLCGQAAGRNRLCLEKIATNRRNFGVPDSTGAEIRDLPVHSSGPESYIATWPDLDGTAAALNAAGIPAAVSEDCGTHLCNQLLYLALHAAETNRARVTATFLHVPLLPEQVIAGEPAALRHPACPYMPLSMTLKALDLVLARAGRLEAAA